MPEIQKETYYFKLVGKNTYFFRVDYFGFLKGTTENGKETDGIILCHCYNKSTDLMPHATWSTFNARIDELCHKFNLKYESLENEKEIATLKLLYEK